jgi:hypothetical protein
MSISELRDDFRERLAGFAWDQWGQMGVSAGAQRREIRATDPEALLLLTFEVGREEPRLFEEVLDWLVVNERLISVQRLRNLAADDDDRALVEAVVGWLGQNRRRPRLGAKSSAYDVERDPRPFFRNLALPVTDPDPAFFAQGFLKPATERSGKSRSPDLRLPINFAFRLRLILGIGVRAEVVRILLTVDASMVNAQALAAMTTYTKRNVQDAASALAAAGAATTWVVGNENRFGPTLSNWERFLEIGELPLHVDWPQLLRACRVVLRWLDEAAEADFSDYMRLSEARALLEEIEPDLRFAGVPSPFVDASLTFEGFEQFIRGLVPAG